MYTLYSQWNNAKQEGVCHSGNRSYDRFPADARPNILSRIGCMCIFSNSFHLALYLQIDSPLTHSLSPLCCLLHTLKTKAQNHPLHSFIIFFSYPSSNTTYDEKKQPSQASICGHFPRLLSLSLSPSRSQYDILSLQQCFALLLHPSAILIKLIAFSSLIIQFQLPTPSKNKKRAKHHGSSVLPYFHTINIC